MSESSKPIPLALPNGLLQELGVVADQMEMSRAELMRLCIRIGLVDLKAAHHDLPGVVKQLADDEGVSFTAFAAAHPCADSAPFARAFPDLKPHPQQHCEHCEVAAAARGGHPAPRHRRRDDQRARTFTPQEKLKHDS